MKSFSVFLFGTILIARSASTGTLVDRWIAGFHRSHPDIPVRQTDTATDLPARALAELVDGEVQLAPFVREIQPQEAASVRQRWGFAPLLLPIASGSYATTANTHAIAIYVHASNPLDRLTLPQLAAIFGGTPQAPNLEIRASAPSADRTSAPDANGGTPQAPNLEIGASAPGADRTSAPDFKIRSLRCWGQLGLTGAWADRPIHAYGMVVHRTTGNPHAGIVAFLMDRVLGGAEFSPAVRQVPDTGMGRGNNRALDEIAEAVAGDPDAIGYAGFQQRRPGIKTVALAEKPGGPYFAGTEAEVAARRYPLTRTIFMAAKAGPGAPLPPPVRDFLDYILSPAGQAAVAADEAHFLPLPPVMAEGERAALKVDR